MRLKSLPIDELMRRVEEELRDVLGRPGNLMLAGGSTPFAMYRRLAERPSPVHAQRRIFLSDERLVPFDSPQSNGGRLLPILRALGCEDRFVSIDPTLPAPLVAKRFSIALAEMERVDYALMGMGADGHVAGIFDPVRARKREGPLAFWTERPDGTKGVSVSPLFLQRCERIVLPVLGGGKRAAVEALAECPESLVAGLVMAGLPNVELRTDLSLRSAGKSL